MQLSAHTAGALEAAGSEQALTESLPRLDPLYLRQRLILEAEYERLVRRPLRRFFHFEHWWSVHSLIRNSLRIVGLYERARRNVRALRVVANDIYLADLAPALSGFRILQITDAHLDMYPEVPEVLTACVRDLLYDACVLTGDFRTRTFGAHEPTLQAMARLRPHLKGPVYAVLGNHDTVRLVPDMEAMGIRVLLNEAMALDREQGLWLAGIDDAHYYKLHDISRVARAIPAGAVSILLSHTPETYAEASAAGFRVMLSGHTHGGQICLPGGVPIITDTHHCPRRYTKGPWRHGNLIGYTSVGSGASIVDVRLNCPPEVTLHRLVRG